LKKLLSERGISLTLTDSARDALAEEGYDPHFGARPLKRTLQRRIQNPLAMKLLEGAFKAGDTVEVRYASGTYEFRTVKPARTAERAHA
jgi:ATP-dependent Clp protease ATP-binding subunit ClpB